jgi:NAD(P)-dependent dehydrogenase (short-subunit alcohol dehydrogenase family)
LAESVNHQTSRLSPYSSLRATLVQLIGSHVTGVQGDVANLADLDRLYAMVKQQKGRIDILFANAGTGSLAPLGSISEEHYDREFDTNVKGTLFTVQKALPLLVDGASITLGASTGTITAIQRSASTALRRPPSATSRVAGFSI